MKKVLLSFAFVLSFMFSYAQRNCATMDNLDRLKSIDAAYEERMNAIEAQTQRIVRQESGANGFTNKTTAVVNIPVVVHVLYNTSAQNISDAQIQSQITILNNDFRRLNADRVNTPSTFTSVAADAEITFCLASKSPTGATTTGITRTYTATTSFAADDKMKSSSTGGVNPWPTDKYLNIWVCNLGGGLLGYAQFPGGSSLTDGVVVGHNYFGNTGTATAPFNKGRTATHEVGHWLNLRHIWGDGTCATDYVSDTPTHNTSNYGCPTHPKSNTCGASAEMFMNYMDYTDDGCMNMFSLGQKTRMQALFATGGARASLLTSSGCGSGSTTTCAVPSGLNATSITTSGATLNWTALSGASSYNIQHKAASATTWTTTTSTTNSKAISGLTAGTSYQFQVQSVCTSGSSAYSAAVSFTTTGSTATTTTITLGSGTSTTVIAPYGTYYMDEKVQFILTKSEMIAAGYSTSNNMLRSLAFNVSSASTQVMNGFTIKMRHTANTSFSSTSFLSSTGMITVLNRNLSVVTGWNTHTFATPFVYNGVDNVLIEICWNNSTYSSDSKVFASALTTNNTLYLKSDVSAGGICTNTTGTRTTTRPHMRLSFSGYSSVFSTRQVGDLEIEEAPAKATSFNVFPNPVKSLLNMELNNSSKVMEDVKLVVYNLLGENIIEKKQSVEPGVQVISLELSESEKWNTLPDGLYFCSVTINGETKTGKFILQK